MCVPASPKPWKRWRRPRGSTDAPPPLKKAAHARAAFSSPFLPRGGRRCCLPPVEANHSAHHNGLPGPAVAGRRERDVISNQGILEYGDAGLIVACLALGDRGRFGGIGLRGAVLAHLVAQGFAVGPR